MKLYFGLVISIFFINHSFSQEGVYATLHLSDYDLKGPVKSIRKYKLRMHGKDSSFAYPIDSATYNGGYDFNIDGLKIKSTFVNNSGIDEYLYHYNNGLLEKVECTGICATPKQYAIISYDTLKNIVYSIHFGQIGNKIDTTFRIIEEFNDHGLLIHYEAEFKPNDWRHWEIIDYEYDDYDRLTLKTSYSHNYYLIDSTKTVYIESENMKYEIDLENDPKSIVPPKIKYVWDANGNTIEKTWIRKDESISEVNKFVYKFDEYTNWIEKKHFRNEKLVEIEYRVFEYF